MAAYHTVLVHFPIALWIVSVLAITIRAFSEGPLAQAMDRSLPLLLSLGVIFGIVAYAAGALIWPWETISSTPMGRNHMMVASWSLAYFTLLAAIRILRGQAIWDGLSRWVMLLLGGIGFVLVGVTGTLGGHLHGSYTELGRVLRWLGLEVYRTYHVPNLTLVVIVIVSVMLLGLAVIGRVRDQTSPG